MNSKRLTCAALLLAGSSLLLATPGLAQTPPHSHPSFHGGPPGGHPGHAPHFAFAHRDFGHFTPFERSSWIGGRWNHGWHNGRFGWWWFAGGAWYFYGAPIYPYPGYVSDDYVDADDSAPGQTWYYCQSPPGYYPYVQSCRIPWQPVPASPPPPAAGYGPPPGGGYGPPPDAAGGPPDDQPPPGYQSEGPGYPPNGPPPGYQGPGPDDQPPPGYPPNGPQTGSQGPGPGDQPLPPPH